MAFVNFYLIAGGTGASDINAGSTTGAAQATTTNGNWNAVTGVFTATGGTPFASTVVGDYASVYLDAATITLFVGKVTTVTSSTVITVDVTTVFYGTKPTTGATGRSCTINGAWNSVAALGGGGLTGTVPQSTKINIKGNQTIGASTTLALIGTATAPLWYDGYNTTPGDLDADTTNTLAKPIWTISSTFILTTSGAQTIVSNLDITGSRTGTVWTHTGTQGKIIRCRCVNTSSNAGAIAFTLNGAASMAAYSYCKTPTTATTTGTVSISGGNSIFIGCVAEGGGIAGFNGANQTTQFWNCIGLNNTGAGFLFSTGAAQILGCTVLSSGGTVDGVKWSGTPAARSCVVGCLVAGPNGGTAITNGINMASVTGLLERSCNDYYNVTNTEVNLGDTSAWFGQTDSSFPINSATNLSPVATANAFRHGFPGIFENQTFNGYPSVGAVDPLISGLFVQ